MPSGTTPEQLNNYLLEYIRDLKGVTVYIEGSRQGQVYNELSQEEAFDIVSQETIGVSTSIDGEDIECKCQKPKDEEGNEIEGCVIPEKKA